MYNDIHFGIKKAIDILSLLVLQWHICDMVNKLLLSISWVMRLDHQLNMLCAVDAFIVIACFVFSLNMNVSHADSLPA